jgi:hypothetical protein
LDASTELPQLAFLAAERVPVLSVPPILAISGFGIGIGGGFGFGISCALVVARTAWVGIHCNCFGFGSNNDFLASGIMIAAKVFGGLIIFEVLVAFADIIVTIVPVVGFRIGFWDCFRSSFGFRFGGCPCCLQAGQHE